MKIMQAPSVTKLHEKLTDEEVDENDLGDRR